jgi:hypothetical protein
MKPDPVVVGIVIAVLILLLVLAVLRRPRGPRYCLNEPFLSPAELVFYRALERAVGSNCRILSKVRLADLVRPEKGLDRKDWQSAFNRVCAKHVDFVVCDSAALKPIVALELDDKSHQQEKRVERDDFLNELFARLTLPLMRVPVQKSYDVRALRVQMEEEVKQKGKLAAR